MKAAGVIEKPMDIGLILEVMDTQGEVMLSLDFKEIRRASRRRTGQHHIAGRKRWKWRTVSLGPWSWYRGERPIRAGGANRRNLHDARPQRRERESRSGCHHHFIASGMWERFHSSAA
jgi:hypothetical protein